MQVPIADPGALSSTASSREVANHHGLDAWTAPVHGHGVSNLFVARLYDEELAALECALGKVTIDCTFG